MERPAQGSTAAESDLVEPEGRADQGAAGGLRPAWKGFAAYLAYQALAVVVWIMPIQGHIGSRLVSTVRGDADAFMWFLRWTPWALAHGMSPLSTTYVFAPNGTDLTWTAFIPGPSLVLWPVTRVFGSIVALNVLMIVAPALAAWATYLVCHRVTGRFWASLAGGAFFGFSTFMAGQLFSSHANLVLIFPVPLAAYLVVRRLEGSLGPVAFVVWLGVTLIGLLSISTELFATMTLFGGIAFAITFAFAFGREARHRVLEAGLLVAASYGACLLVLSPLVLTTLRHAPPGTLRGSDRVVNGLSFLVPRTGTLIGGSTFARITDRFTAHAPEDAGYVGIGVLAVLIAYAITERHHRETWALLSFVAVGSVLSLGAHLFIGGRQLFWLPGALLYHFPLIKNATAQRFPAYTALAIGVIVAIWLARANGGWGWARWTLVLVAGALLLPTTSPHQPVRLPAFFEDGTFRDVLRPDENVLVLPKERGDEMLWQASSGFWFRMPQGYIGKVSETLREDLLGRRTPTAAALASILTAKRVDAVLLEDRERTRFAPLLRSVGLLPVYEGGGVSVWRRSGGPAPSPGD